MHTSNTRAHTKTHTNKQSERDTFALNTEFKYLRSNEI